jgi:twinkle protein
MRKSGDDSHRPGKWDIRGASEITDLADNVFICWKNIPKEKAQEQIEFGNPNADTSKLDEADQYLTVAKQRHGEWEGAFQFWFDNPTLQFLEFANAQPVTTDGIYEQEVRDKYKGMVA